MQQSIVSAGIDIGTSTTQVIFSRLTLEDNSYTAVPSVKIKTKEILYRSAAHFTPLLGRDTIDVEAVEGILREEYSLAGIDKGEITTGAVIITGESARKENAREALMGISALAGDFVVAEAGADLESVLAGYGAGAADLSREREGSVANFDIGGGTTNTAVFADGNLVDAFALDIGGRLVRLDAAGAITYISPRLAPLIAEIGVPLMVGFCPTVAELRALADAMARVLYKICTARKLTAAERALFIAHADSGAPLTQVMFSGGVAEFIYNEETPQDIAAVSVFGDIGPLLGAAVREMFRAAPDVTLLTSREQLRATVIGAGSYSISISGSTVLANDAYVPLKNIPIVRLENLAEDRLADLAAEIRLKRGLFAAGEQVAYAFAGVRSPSYSYLKALAAVLADATSDELLIVIAYEDMAKALGLVLSQQPTIQGQGRRLIVLDRIVARQGDYIDIGKSVAGIVPVIVKTLIFEG